AELACAKALWLEATSQWGTEHERSVLRDTRSQEGPAQGHLEALAECRGGICHRVGQVIKGYPWE
ncbi:unnamed protein product, partial [Gulo gulo]